MHYHSYIKKDYKDVLGAPLVPTKRRRRRRWPLLLATAVGVIVAVNLSAHILDMPGGLSETPVPVPVPVNIPLELPGVNTPAAIPQAPSSENSAEQTMFPPPKLSAVAGDETLLPEASQADEAQHTAGHVEETPGKPQEPRLTTVQVEIRKGDTLSAIFERFELDSREMYELLAEKSVKKRLSRLRPGQSLEFRINGENRIQSFVYQVDDVDSLRLSRGENGFQSEWLKKTLEPRTASVKGEITSSLFEAGQDAGLSDKLIMQMVEVLGWDIDFALDIRTGDSFTVIYQELFDQQQKKVRDGPILAVAFNNQGREIRALRYAAPDGRADYYSPDGYSMRKAFLRTPVKFSRISSRFSRGRYHPLLNRIRAHKGVDYAAPTGTPVKATGAGKIIYRNSKGGYGRTVIIQHGGKYTTLYAHLSRYARGLRTGKRVRQGQVIGYVGTSGLATGPHLHYEFRVRSQHRDPLRVRLPKAKPVAKEYREDFDRKTQPLLTQLEILRHTQLAQNDG